VRLFRRKKVWYAHIYDANGVRFQRSTRCHDYAAAEKVARRFERDAADPDYAAARTALLRDAIRLMLEHYGELVRAGRKAEATLRCYRQKAGHLSRLFEPDGDPLPLAALKARHVDEYISARRSEGVSESTIHKELTILRIALKLARRRGLWRGDPADVMPVGFAPRYIPRDRKLTREELQRLLPQLLGDRAARAAFIVATGACWGESDRALRKDVREAVVIIHGTKRREGVRAACYAAGGEERPVIERLVPIVADVQRTLLDYALKHAEGKDGLLFSPWGNVRGDLREACTKAGIEPCSPNDLRRTFASWMHAAGAPLDLLFPLMGHADTRMLERVYARLSPDELAERLRWQLAATGSAAAAPVALPAANCSTGATDSGEIAGPAGLPGQPAQAISQPSVPRVRIELTTRGFSVRCSTN